MRHTYSSSSTSNMAVYYTECKVSAGAGSKKLSANKLSVSVGNSFSHCYGGEDFAAAAHGQKNAQYKHKVAAAVS